MKILQEIVIPLLKAKNYWNLFKNNNLNEDFSKTFVLAIGKGSAAILKSHPNYSQISKNGHFIVYEKKNSLLKLQENTIFGDHPYLSKDNINNSYETLVKINNSQTQSLILILSGGTSSLFEVPLFADHIDIQEHIYKCLITKGANILETNLIRKSLSKSKNGGINLLINKPIQTLILSDIPGNDPYLVGSSPTLYKELDKQQLLQISKHYLRKPYYQIYKSLIESQVWNQHQEKLNKVDNTNYKIIADSLVFTNMIGSALSPYGKTKIILPELDENLFQIISNSFNDKSWKYLILCGEQPVNVTKNNSHGGRCTHLAATILLYLLESKRQSSDLESLLFLATDSTDGPHNHCGCFIQNKDIIQTHQEELKTHIENFTTATFFQTQGLLLSSILSEVNFMDLVIISRYQ